MSYNAGKNFQISRVHQLEVGATTKEEVLQLFGPPFERLDAGKYKQQRVHFGDEGTILIWRYVYLSASLVQTSMRVLNLDFDSNGRLVDYFCISQFSEDKTPDLIDKTANFDIFLARHNVIPGKSTRAEIAILLGTGHTLLPINKSGVSERWYYGYSEVSITETYHYLGKRSQQVFSKSVIIDFDTDGIVQHIKGESDFPDDLARK